MRISVDFPVAVLSGYLGVTLSISIDLLHNGYLYIKVIEIIDVLGRGGDIIEGLARINNYKYMTYIANGNTVLYKWT